MNIVLFCNRLHGGGAERFTTTIANEFSKQSDCSVSVVTGSEDKDDYELSSGVHRYSFLTGNFFFDCLKILSLTNRNKIDVLISIGIYTNLCISLCSIFTKVPCIISERNSPKHTTISWKSKILRKLLFKYADGYVFQTKDAQNFYSKNIQKRSIVIHNPIRTGLPEKTNVNAKEIVAIGRLHKQKNYPLLIRAFEKVHKAHPDFVLRIYGEGSDLESLQKLSNELNLDRNVLFEGFSRNVHDYIKNSMIYVMSSDFEGMPNALMEAMAMGFPVISTDCPVGGPAELIKDNENGLLVPVGDVNALSDKMLLLIEHEDFRKKIAMNAKNIINTHDVTYICKQWLVFIYSVINSVKK